MASNTSLKDILLADEANAKAPSTGAGEVLSPGKYVAKILGFIEEPTYNAVDVEINKSKYRFFYDFYIYKTTDLNLNVIQWFKALATIPTTEKTTLLEIANSAIGSSYMVEVYNYVSKSGKNAGKTNMALDFQVLPKLETVVIETEEVELPI